MEMCLAPEDVEQHDGASEDESPLSPLSPVSAVSHDDDLARTLPLVDAAAADQYQLDAYRGSRDDVGNHEPEQSLVQLDVDPYAAEDCATRQVGPMVDLRNPRNRAAMRVLGLTVNDVTPRPIEKDQEPCSPAERRKRALSHFTRLEASRRRVMAEVERTAALLSGNELGQILSHENPPAADDDLAMPALSSTAFASQSPHTVSVLPARPKASPRRAKVAAPRDTQQPGSCSPRNESGYIDSFVNSSMAGFDNHLNEIVMNFTHETVWHQCKQLDVHEDRAACIDGWFENVIGPTGQQPALAGWRETVDGTGERVSLQQWMASVGCSREAPPPEVKLPGQIIDEALERTEKNRTRIHAEAARLRRAKRELTGGLVVASQARLQRANCVANELIAAKAVEVESRGLRYPGFRARGHHGMTAAPRALPPISPGSSSVSHKSPRLRGIKATHGLE